jgi:hypothetical protein
MPNDKNAPLSEGEIQRRMDEAVRRALTTPPTPTKELVGKSERAERLKKARQSKPK